MRQPLGSWATPLPRMPGRFGAGAARCAIVTSPVVVTRRTSPKRTKTTRRMRYIVFHSANDDLSAERRGYSVE